MLRARQWLLFIVTAMLTLPTSAFSGADPASADTGVTIEVATDDSSGSVPMKQRDYAKKLHSKLKRSGPPAQKPKYKPWNKVVTSDHKKIEGLLPMYRQGEEVLLALSPELMDKPMLAVLTISQGIGSHFVFGGLALDEVMFDFHRDEDHIQIRRLSTRFRAPGDENLAQTINLTFSESILSSLPVKTEKNGTCVIDVTGFFLSDVAGMGSYLSAVFNQPVRFANDKKYFADIRNFPENTEVDTRLTYSPGRPEVLNLPNVSDPRFVQVGVHYSIMKLPEDPIMPRIADDRVGYFTTAFKDFTRVGKESYFVHYANHWRLEKKNPGAAVSEVVKPITFYIDHTVPDKYVPFMIEGVELWQRAFEKAGFKKAIVAKRAPTPEEDPEYDPADARYNTIRWNTSDQAFYIAIGPSRVDPRTGEIIDADILIENNIAASFGKNWRRYAAPRDALMAMDPTLRELWMTDEEKAASVDFSKIPSLGEEHAYGCDLAEGMALGGHIQWLSMVASGLVDPAQPMPDEFVGEAVRFVTAHEVGHTLGLRHNFKSSGSTPYTELQNKAFAEKNGLAGSVMDYSAANVSINPDDQGYYYMPSVGTYDDWAIKWGYSEVDGKDEWAQSEKLDKIAGQCDDKGHCYGTDWDTYPAHAMDPRTNIWDLSDDPMAWAEERIALCDHLLSGNTLEERTVADGESYAGLRNAVETIFLQKFRALTVAVKNIGGQYTEQAHKGDEGQPFSPVPAAEQRRALTLLTTHGLDAERFMLAPGVLAKLTENRLIDWEDNFYQPGRRFDFPLSAWIRGLQNAVLTLVLESTLQTRVVDSSLHMDDPFALSDLYDGLTEAVWGDGRGNRRRAAAADRDLQRIYTGKLIAQITDPAPGTPHDAIALSRLHLQRIKQRANRGLGSGRLDDTTRAHLGETVARIDRALDAGRVTNF